MKPVEPAELSAYLDGEVATDRALEIEAALARNPALRAAFDELAQADAAWRTAARSAAFSPMVHLTADMGPATSFSRILLAVFALLAVRFVPKMMDSLSWDIAIQSVVLLLAIGWIMQWANFAEGEVRHSS